MSFTLDKSNSLARKPYWQYSGISLDDNSEATPEVNSTIKPLKDRELATEELEKFEKVLFPTGEIFSVLGNKHSKGKNSGTPVNLPEGSFVFSNYKPLSINKEDKELFKFKEGGKINTPAKILQNEVDIKHHNKMIAISSDDKFDDISKKSAILMLQKNLKKAGQVAYLQEERKGFPDGLPQFAQGTAPIKDENIDVMEQQYKTGGFTSLNKYQDGGYKTGYFDGKGYHQNKGPREQKVAPFREDSLNPWSNVYNYYNRNFDYSGQPNNVDEWQKWMIQNKPEELKKYLQNVPLTNKGIRAYGNKSPNQLNDNELFNQFNDKLYDFRAPRIPLNASPVNPNREYSNPPSTLPNWSPTPLGNNPNIQISNNPQEENLQTLPYEPNVPLSNLQKFSLANSAYDAININKYGPKRQQLSFTPVNLERINSQPYLNATNNQTQQAYKANQAFNPIQARAANSLTYGQGLDKASETVGNIYNQNSQISNQENLYNNQGINNTANSNVNYDNQYYNQTKELAQNYDTEKMFAKNRLLDEYKGYRTNNQDLELKLASQPTFGSYPVWIGPKGEVSKIPKQGWTKKLQSAPLYDYNNRTNKVFYTGAGLSMDQIPNTNQNDPVVLKFQQNILNGTATDAEKLAYSRFYKQLYPSSKR